MALVIGFGALVWHWNQKTVENKYQPLIAEIREAITFLKEKKQ